MNLIMIVFERRKIKNNYIKIIYVEKRRRPNHIFKKITLKIPTSESWFIRRYWGIHQECTVEAVSSDALHHFLTALLPTLNLQTFRKDWHCHLGLSPSWDFYNILFNSHIHSLSYAKLSFILGFLILFPYVEFFSRRTLHFLITLLWLLVSLVAIVDPWNRRLHGVEILGTLWIPLGQRFWGMRNRNVSWGYIGWLCGFLTEETSVPGKHMRQHLAVKMIKSCFLPTFAYDLETNHDNQCAPNALWGHRELSQKICVCWSLYTLKSGTLSQCWDPPTLQVFDTWECVCSSVCW